MEVNTIVQIFQQLEAASAVLSKYVNVMATLVGIGAILLVQWKAPGPNNGRSAWWETEPGHVVSRLLPFVGPAAAFFACIGLEWDKTFNASDVVRAFLSGVLSEFALRVVFKTGFGK